jgi:hypothetical protein
LCMIPNRIVKKIITVNGLIGLPMDKNQFGCKLGAVIMLVFINK